MSPDSSYLFLIFAVKPFTMGVLFLLLVIFVLLILNALISASEVAFFSLDPKELELLNESKSNADKTILKLLEKPKHLLATQLIGINLLSIGVIIISDLVTHAQFDFSDNPTLGFVIKVIVITFLILVISEVIPKVYANQHPITTARVMALPILALQKISWPISTLLIASTSLIDKRVKKRTSGISVDELSHALELTSSEDKPEDMRILRGIVKFGEMDVKEIMKPRMDITAFDFNTPFTKLMNDIRSSGFSRVPIYKGNFDKVEGVLYIKDLLPHIEKGDDFNWQELIREPFFVPENKMIDDLLKEFQHKRIHLAVVVDEYGGTSGIVTLEDVIEEIVGEINDEFDDDDLIYSRLDDYNFVFEGKISLSDLCRKLNIEKEIFETDQGDSDTLAGFLLEVSGKIPKKNDSIKFRDYIFTIESADARKIKRVKVTLPKDEN